MDHSEAPLKDADKVNIDVQKGSGAKDTSGTFQWQILPFQ